MEGNGPAKDVSPLQAKTGQIERCEIGDHRSELRLVDRSPELKRLHRKKPPEWSGGLRESKRMESGFD